MREGKEKDASRKRVDIVGPVCETGDCFLRMAARRVHAGDLLAIWVAGAYGMSQASNYNARCRPAEVLVECNPSARDNLRCRPKLARTFRAQQIVLSFAPANSAESVLPSTKTSAGRIARYSFDACDIPYAPATQIASKVAGVHFAERPIPQKAIARLANRPTISTRLRLASFSFPSRIIFVMGWIAP